MRHASAVFAYLDPGTGSMLLQVLLGGIAAIAVGGRVMWQRLTGRNRPQSPSSDDSVQPAERDSSADSQ
jgi:hypothetical protein